MGSIRSTKNKVGGWYYYERAKKFTCRHGHEGIRFYDQDKDKMVIVYIGDTIDTEQEGPQEIREMAELCHLYGGMHGQCGDGHFRVVKRFWHG